MSYTFCKAVPLSPVEAEEKLRALLAENGFGVLTATYRRH